MSDVPRVRSTWGRRPGSMGPPVWVIVCPWCDSQHFHMGPQGHRVSQCDVTDADPDAIGWPNGGGR